MLNYANLNDVEFEYLCQDIFSKKLGVQLRRFAMGRDGGIDLTDNVFERNIIVQVKNYIKTDISGLISSLKKEIPKVEDLKPNQYYICCSKELSPAKIKEIYEMFYEYMDSDANIYTINEINDFLENPENLDILRKHYKLWISSTNILQDIYNNDIFIDCEDLLSNVQEDEKYFVQTIAYEKALECLSKNKVLFITGDPGVGKTITSKMLILYYAAIKYRVRYTTDGSDLSSLKKALSLDKEAKEIILLDDCFGQAYFSMKSTQGNELLSIIKHVNLSKNKRLILNSRITIYHEAQERTQGLIKSFENKEYKVHIINISDMSGLEKAKILYNHLYFNNIKEEYYSKLKENNNYRTIVNHPNYNPRIIEFISNPYRYADIIPDHYYKFILDHLDNPDKVWDDEYEHKLTRTDRMLITTLFSMTDTTASLELVKRSFNARIQGLPDIDLTINQFQNSLKRLQQAFLKIIDDKGHPMLSMVNPSINDYLRSRIDKNIAEKEDLINSASCLIQFKKLLNPEQFTLKLDNAFADESIINYFFENDKEKADYITYLISLNKITNIKYKQYIYTYLSNANDVNIYEKSRVSIITIFKNLFDNRILSFYEIGGFLSNFNILENLLCKFKFDHLVDAIGCCYFLYMYKPEFINLCKKLIEKSIKSFCENINAEEYDVDVQESIKNAHYTVYNYDFEEDMIDFDYVVDDVENAIKEMVKYDIFEYMDKLPDELHIPIDGINISINGIEDLVNSYINIDYDDDGYDDERPHSDINEIDLIFDR